jgi:hypothetical protein
MLILVLFSQIFSVYPYERVMFSPDAIVERRAFLSRDYFYPWVFSGIVFYPAGIRSFSLGARYKFLDFSVGLLSTGDIKSYDEYAQEIGSYSTNILRGTAGFELPLDFLNVKASLSGMRAYGPDFYESRVWVDLDFYRTLFAFENVALGMTLSYEPSFGFYLFGPYHFLGGDFYKRDNYEFKAGFYRSFKFAGFLLGFSYMVSGGETTFKPYFSFKVRHKNLSFYYFYRVEREITDISGISVCYE